MAHPYRVVTSLNYAHTPLVGFYFLAALAFGACILQKAKPISLKRRLLSIFLIVIIFSAYITEAIYYLRQTVADFNYAAPQHAVFHCLSSILLWTPICFSIWKGNNLLWHPYFGAFALEFAFEATLCILRGTTRPKGNSHYGAPVSFASIRSLVSLVLLLDGFLILLSKQPEKGTDEESQPLLGQQANSSLNSESGYGSIQAPSNEEEEEGPKDRNKEIKEQQAKRLEEQGGWWGYLMGFAVFIPHIWPKDDWILVFCLIIRGLNLVQGRIFNLLTPRQIGIIADKLTNQTTPFMPWHDIMLWGFFTWFNSYAGFRIFDFFAGQYIQDTARKRLNALTFKHIMDLSMDFHTNKSSGEIIKAIEQAASLNKLIEVVFFEACPILVDLVIAMWYVSHLFNVYMAFIILYMGACYIWLGICFDSSSNSRHRVYQEKLRFESTTIYEAISNWLTTLFFNRQLYERKQYDNAVQDTTSTRYSYLHRYLRGFAIQSTVTRFGLVGCCIFAISQIVHQRKPVGSLTTFIIYWEAMINPLLSISESYHNISTYLIDAERVLQLLNTKPTVVDPENPKTLCLESTKVEFKDVEFGYDPRKQVLKDINFTAEGGQTVAFVGESGGGKSTILKLLLRSWDVTGGFIQIGGQDLRSVTQSDLHDALGFVPQDPTLFNKTIRDNIRYARLDATDTEIEEACRAAAIHETIMSFPDGYKSKVGERGVKLSGGQIQRIAIARVFLKDPKIVLLDEATSAVDSSIEAQIQEAFRKLSIGRTTFVIAHRLSTIVNADQIFVVDKGKIIERGTHSELLEIEDGKYAELWTKQTTANLKVGSKADSTYG